MEDARKEAGRWFCSPSCLLQGSPGKWKNEKRSGPVRRFIKRTLIVLGALAVVGVVAAVIGSRSNNGNTTKTSTSHVANAVSPSVGASNIPLRTMAGVWKGWRLKVTSVTPKALQLLGQAPRKTPAGGQDFMVVVAVKYTGGGYGHLRDLLKRLYASGTHSVYYSADGGALNCTTRRGVASSKPLNETNRLVFPGHVARGHLCFLIASNDASGLSLYVDRPGCNTAPTHDNCQDKVWFALRR